MTFIDLEKDGLLEKITLPQDLLKELPAQGVGIDLRSPQNTWYASALSSFGIFYNKKLVAQQKTIVPKTLMLFIVFSLLPRLVVLLVVLPVVLPVVRSVLPVPVVVLGLHWHLSFVVGHTWPFRSSWRHS